MQVAALYTDRLGPYPLMPDVDAWDLARDATKYEGPYPVVAHPPCGPWGRLAHMSRHDDPKLALRAVEQVRAWGGVLEHPAHSKLWLAAGLPFPGPTVDAFGGRTIEVCQCDFGHVARKRTWLYLVRVNTPPLLSQREPTHWISGGRGREGVKHATSLVPEGFKICSAEQRRRTPKAFARWLVETARTAHVRNVISGTT